MQFSRIGIRLRGLGQGPQRQRRGQHSHASNSATIQSSRTPTTQPGNQRKGGQGRNMMLNPARTATPRARRRCWAPGRSLGLDRKPCNGRRRLGREKRARGKGRRGTESP